MLLLRCCCSQGNATNYHFLIQQLSTPGKSDVKTRRKIYLALPRCISTMAKEPQAYQQLLDVLFKFTFLEEREEIEAFTRFIVHLVSSNTVYVLPTLQMLTRNLCRPQQLPPALVAAANASAAPTAVKRVSIGSSFGGITSSAGAAAAPAVEPIDVEARIEQRYASVHETYQRVLALVPTAANILFPIICEHFPHKRLDAPFQVAYLKNVLKLSTYVPGLQERIFGLIVDQLVAVDVEIKLDDKEEDIFTMDDFLDDELLPADSSKVDEMADKLDQMMVIMFAHIEQIVGASGLDGGASELNVQKAASVFKFLLKVFEHSILNTHRSKYPQFLLFYVCRMDPQFQDVLISQLLAASLDPQVPPVTRHSCGAYLASLLARAKYISVAYIQKALYHLLKWMHDQMDIYDATTSQPKAAAGEGGSDDEEGDGTSGSLEAEAAELEEKDNRGNFQESIFISTLQTVCYMLCFRGLEIAQAPNGYDFLRTLGWERLLITSTSYCPLAFCQQTVATEFLNFVETFDLISEDCIDRVDQAISSTGKGAFKTKTKTMERSTAPTSANSSSILLGQRQPLETFFPFDPYLLRRSFKYIGPLYLYWKHADPTSSENCDALNEVKAIIREFEAEEDGGEGEDDEDEEDDEDDEDDDEDVSMSGSVGTGSASFKGLSYLENLGRDSEQRAYGMSIGSSYDGDYSFDDRDRELKAMGVATSKKRSSNRRPASRSTFDPSPALSASSPPSRLPPLGSANAFTLGGFDDYEDDGF